MIDGHPIIDADSHKCENPLVFCDYIPAGFRERFSVVRDRYGEQRFQILDRNPDTGANDLPRVFLQADGYGKGTYRPYHEETTLGGLFNRIRLEHMDREGIDHQVVYGSITLAFSSLMDEELGIALCRAYNDYIHDDCLPFADRLHPVGVLPLQDPAEAVHELRRCVLELGMPAVSVAPNLPQAHPDAPEAYPNIRVPKALSHPDFDPIWEEAERLDVAIGIHGAPGCQLAAGAADQLDTFTLVHVFANRNMQQMAIAKLIFDGVMERYARLRFGFLEAGVGWFPDLIHSLHEHWEKRIKNFDPTVEPSILDILTEFAREPAPGAGRGMLRKVRQLASILGPKTENMVGPDELEAFRYEHPNLPRDPYEYVERGQIFLSFEPDDPAVEYLPTAMGDVGCRLSCVAIDYGHWDAQLAGCVNAVASRPGIDPEYAMRLLSLNALEFYGDRLRERICHVPFRVDPASAPEPREDGSHAL